MFSNKIFYMLALIVGVFGVVSSIENSLFSLFSILVVSWASYLLGKNEERKW